MNEITEKAMLVRLNIKQWTARKYDKEVTYKVEETYNAHNAGRFNKRLVAEEAINAVNKTASAARVFHYENTLPWADDGARILLAKNYLPYTGKMRELKSVFEEAVGGFVANYEALVEDARESLNGMFKPEDYPSESKIKKKYGLEVSVNPLPSENDFRVTLQSEEVDQIKARIQERNKLAYQDAMQSVWQRLYKNVKHMADKLHDPGSRLHSSMVSNLCDLCALLPRLNLEDSKELEEMRREVEEKLCRVEPKELRKNKKIRSQVATEASEILDVMKGYMGDG